MSTWAKFGMRLYWLEYRVKIAKNQNINQSILVIDYQFKDTHLELIPINSGLNPLYKNVYYMGLKIILLKINPKNLQNLKKYLGTGRANSSGSEEVNELSFPTCGDLPS
jgi:hypothetical protein